METAQAPQPRAPLSDRGYIGLSFSGGGYRATAFSLGTMALLQDLGLLGKARVMSSVSGGSLALGAYLCAKAGANPAQEEDFPFYERFWQPLMEALGSEELARAFVQLPVLLEGGKLILHAADASQTFFNKLLGQEATLGNAAISHMLSQHSLSPDYAFFNAANISSLDLFRFGIQRGNQAAQDEPVFVLNRYFLPARGGSLEASDLYRHAQRLRLGDCVAASFAFPGGFEPLIFPDDYFRTAETAEEEQLRAEACRRFRHSLICDRRPYVAFLDGGLYDNLGLASVEDIRRFLARRCEDLDLRHRFHPGPAETREREQPIHYVIATDVDNIQPGVGFYDEPSLDRRLGQPLTPTEPAAPGRRGGSLLLLAPLASAGVLTLLGFAMGILASRLEPPSGGLLAFLALGLAALLVVLSQGLLLRFLRGRLEAIDLRQALGLSPDFDAGNQALNLWALASRLLRNLLQGSRSAGPWAALRSATLERRAGQLLPAFSGYLKRTRSLTYGYLQKSYEPAHERMGGAQRCHLIRNMIFELIAGPDVDPAFAAELITLPVRDYRRQEEVRQDRLTPPIIRKLRHAAYAQDLLFALERRSNPHGQAPEPSRAMDLALELLAPRPGAEREEDLLRSRSDLQLFRVACLWHWLTAALEMDAGDALEAGPLADHPHPTLRTLVGDVRRTLRTAALQARTVDAGDAMPLLRERCAIRFGEDAASYSWIPLICEMATNLGTTLWVEGYRWYEPNRLEDQRISRIGCWHGHEPGREPGAMPVLDLGLENLQAPAAAITTLAGYLITGFNLLDFFYASLGSSRPLRDQLTQMLLKRRDDDWDENSLRQLAELPFALRQAALRELRVSKRLAPGDPLTGQLALLEPRLTCRDGYPEEG